MNICYITSELTPLAKVGGLADVAGALPPRLIDRGHDVRVFLPLYDTLEAEASDFDAVEAVQDIPLRLGHTTYNFSLYTIRLPGTDMLVHCVHCPQLYERGAVYTNDVDEAERYVVLSRAAIESCQRLQWAPDVFHVHDWQSALVPLYLGTIYSWDRLFKRSKTLLTIHNIGYQGIFPSTTLARLGLEQGSPLFDQSDLAEGRINFLKTGIRYAHLLSTVSPTYAREIQTPPYGMGLDGFLAERADDVVGILNGVDYGEWHPRTDSLLPYRYSEKSLWRKGKNKEALHEELGLNFEKDVPLVGIVSRLTGQKGFDLLFDVLPDMLSARDLRLVVVGTGEARYEQFFSQLAASHPDSVHFFNGYNNELAHQVEAASDVFLMPSRYEPCGLNQMYSLKYGTVPIVRRTGGLADSVQLWDPVDGTGTGFVFDHYTPDGVRWALTAALDTFADRKVWRTLQLNGMACDFSWETQAEAYVQLYERLAPAPAKAVARPVAIS